MPNHFRIKVEHWDDKAPDTVLLMGEINATETADSNPKYADFNCWISKWGRPQHPLARGNVAFQMSRNSWELVYEMLKAFVQPWREKEAEENAVEAAKQQKAEEKEGK
jgi:hypothetical protein